MWPQLHKGVLLQWGTALLSVQLHWQPSCGHTAYTSRKFFCWCTYTAFLNYSQKALFVSIYWYYISFQCLLRLLHQLQHMISYTMQQHSYSSRPCSVRCDITNLTAHSQVFFSKMEKNNDKKFKKGYNTTWWSSSLLSIQLTKKYQLAAGEKAISDVVCNYSAWGLIWRAVKPIVIWPLISAAWVEFYRVNLFTWQASPFQNGKHR